VFLAAGYSVIKNPGSIGMNCFKTGKKLAAFFFFSILFSTIPLRLQVFAAGENDKGPAWVAPDFKLPDLKGSNVTLSQFRGQKPVLLDFWATWCEICMAVRPKVIELRKAIDVDSGDSLTKVKLFEAANPAPYTVLYDSDSKVTKSYKVVGVPHFVLIDKSGMVKYQGARLPTDPLSLLK
jgi:peroxiredoxin